MLWTDRVI